MPIRTSSRPDPTRIVPDVGRRRPPTSFRIVDLPQPLGPTRATNSPRPIARLAACKATTLWSAAPNFTVTSSSQTCGSSRAACPAATASPTLPASNAAAVGPLAVIEIPPKQRRLQMRDAIGQRRQEAAIEDLCRLWRAGELVRIDHDADVAFEPGVHDIAQAD